LFHNIFTIEEYQAEIVIPKEFEMKVRGWLGNDEALFSQVKKQVIL
jgi:hypothetical protein